MAMSQRESISPASPGSYSALGCLSCGTLENINGRRYCSVICRQRLRRQLNARTGLLKALNTRYATFYFTRSMINLDLLPYDSEDLFSFILPRSQKNQPVEDYIRLTNRLGTLWWAERKRTNKRYMAARTVFDHAGRNYYASENVVPLEFRKPARIQKPLVHLKLSRPDLQHPRLKERIRQAYRRQALKHHPDRGGQAEDFRRIHNAYQQLLDWARHPVFVKRRGFPDKWFYEGRYNRWVQPTPKWK